MSLATRYATKHAKARQRRRHTAQERLARDHRQAQHATKALQQALDDLGLPQDLVTEIEGRLRSQQQLLGKIVGMMCPPLFGCRTNAELCRVRGWDKNLPVAFAQRAPQALLDQAASTLGPGGVGAAVALTPLVQVRPRGAAGSGPGWVMIPCSKSMESSWDSSAPGGVGRNIGSSLALTGSSSWSSWARANWSSPSTLPFVGLPPGPGAPCRDKLHWLQLMLDGRVAAFRRRGVALTPPMVVADSWFGDSKLMRHVTTAHEGTLLVEGKTTYVFELPDGRQVKGHDLQKPGDWPWRESPQVPGVRYVRLWATQSHLWGGDHHYCPGAQRRSVLRDVSGDRHQFAAAHPGVEAAVLDRVLFSDLEAPPGNRRLSGAQ